MPSARTSSATLVAAFCFAWTGYALAVEAPKLPADPRLSAAIKTDQTFNGVALSPKGRVFLPIQRDDPDRGMEVGEAKAGSVVAYPNEAWNSWKTGDDPAKQFVGVNAVRVGPEGDLWVVDPAKPSGSDTAVAAGIKVVRIDLATNQVKRVYPLKDSTGPDSFVDDIRFNGTHAYLTDAGKKAAIIVLDLETGQQRRLLDGTPFVVQGDRVLSGEGRPLRNQKGEPVVINADQLEVSPDGKTFYFQPCTGPLWSVPTALLDDPATSPDALAKAVTRYADTHSTGGSAIAADGTIYISDTDRSAILKIAPGGAVTTLVQDPKLVWVDAMWIDDAGTLWLPAAQRNRAAASNDGKDAIVKPLEVYTMAIGARPVRR